jgi:hypothetical protein
MTRKKEKGIWLLLSAIVLLVFPLHLHAQKLAAQVSKNKVYTGEVFQVSFSANGNISEFRPPALKDFDVYSGPNQSTSVQIINGNMSQTISYSYMIAAKKEGKYAIGAASATVNGNKVESNPITIEVIKGAPPQQNQNHNDPFADFFGNDPNAQQQQQQQQAKPSVDENDLFVRTYVSKKQAYLGEQIVVTHKVYSRLNLRNIQNLKMPGFDGFWSKDEKKTQFTSEVENMDGVNYVVVELSKVYLFPQRTGKLSIDPIELECIVRKQVKKNPSIFDQFFGSAFQDVALKVKSKPVTVEVNSLPEKSKPAGFTGAVGKFNFSTQLSHDRVKANEAITLKLTISGTGNVNLAEGPKITFPDGFETYEPKLSESISTAGGVSGSKTYEYLVVPRREGVYTLQDISFSYFDLDKKQYVTIPSPELKITVDKGDAGSSTGASVYAPKNEVAAQENDIRYIKTGDLQLEASGTEFFGSGRHYFLLVLPVLLFFIFLFSRSIYLKSQSNVVAVNERRAARLARKQLNQAEKLMKQNKRDAFYAEVLTALNNYASYKMNIPVADLSKDTIYNHLVEKQVSPDTIQKFMNALQDCEYARYAPASVEQDLNLVYNNTVELITKVEDESK